MMETVHISFHGDDVIPGTADSSLFHVIPVPLEKSVSYGTGTAGGPAAILEASCQLELLTCGCVPAEHGIYTLPPIDCSGSVEEALQRIQQATAVTLRHGAVPVVLGGEHSLSSGVVAALTEKYEEFGVIQFDAHADLRDSYEGSPHSHACVMRRIHESNIPIIELGIRSYSLEELIYLKEKEIYYLDSETIWRNGPILHLPADFPEKVYISFDVDVFDSSLMPATGTPVPGGLNWYQAMWLMEQITEVRTCIGFDVVELAPLDTMHAPSFAVAQLVYNMMAYLTK